MTAPSPDEILARASAALGSPIVESRRIDRGYTPADRRVVTTADGRRAFVKTATNADTAAWLDVERRVYAQVKGTFLPRSLGYVEGPRPTLILEDLSHAHWPPPWGPGHLPALRSALERKSAASPPAGLPCLVPGDPIVEGWTRVATDPRPFLSLGVASARWLERSLPALLEASASAPLAGDALLHFDVRSDNVCFAGDRAILVDWNHAAIGDPRVELCFFAPSLAYEGGPAPEELLPAEPGLAAVCAGYFAGAAGLPPPVPGSKVRELQRRQLGVALPWAVRALGLESPTA